MGGSNIRTNLSGLLQSLDSPAITGIGSRLLDGRDGKATADRRIYRSGVIKAAKKTSLSGCRA
jgi:hypothetical protein